MAMTFPSTVAVPSTAAYAPPAVDFSWLAKLPEQFNKGRQMARQEAVASAFEGGLPTDKQGNPDYAAMANILLSKGGDLGTALNLFKAGQQTKANDAFVRSVTPNGGAQPAAPSSTPAEPSAPSSMLSPVPMATYADRTMAVEGGGDRFAQNPRSSAMGPAQFIKSTWLDTIKKYRPDLAASKTDAELLALRTDPGISRDLTDAYAADNTQYLRLQGIDNPTPGQLYLAHFAGPQGAARVLTADPATPASAILGPEATRANPFLARMTAGKLVAWADRKMAGVKAPSAGAESATFDQRFAPADQPPLAAGGVPFDQRFANAVPQPASAPNAAIGMPPQTSELSARAPTPAQAADSTAVPAPAPVPGQGAFAPIPADNGVPVDTVPTRPGAPDVAAPQTETSLPVTATPQGDTQGIGRLLATIANPYLSEGARGAAKTMLEHRLKQSDLTNAQKDYVLYRAQGGKLPFLDYQTQLKRAGATNVAVSQTAGGKEFFKGLSERALKAQDTAAEAAGQIRLYETADRLLDDPDVYTGTGGTAISSLKKIGTTLLGLDFKGVANAEVANKITDELALAYKQQSQDQNTSNYERKVYERMATGLNDSAQGRKLLIQLRVADLQHKQKQAEVWREHIKDDGTINPKVFSALAALEAGRRETLGDFLTRANTVAGAAPQASPSAGADDALDNLMKKYKGLK